MIAQILNVYPAASLSMGCIERPAGQLVQACDRLQDLLTFRAGKLLLSDRVPEFNHYQFRHG
jgi:hypothetical protein